MNFVPHALTSAFPNDDHSARRLFLGPEKVDLWFAFPEEFGDTAPLAQYRQLLSGDERVQQDGFHFSRDRRRFLVTRAMVRIVLSRYADTSPELWSFGKNSYGRPHVANDADCPGLTFNISHTDRLIVLAVGRDRALGIDTEHIAARRISLEIADRFFSPAEAWALRRVPEAAQQQRFFEYWTLKEAYIKARGKGLSIPLDQFSFSFPAEGRVQLSIDPIQDDCASRWSFRQFLTSAEHMVSLCVENRQSSPTEITMRTIIPLVDERLVSFVTLRETEPTECPRR
jgi:4'-phosphopantetheinyl transferase